MKGLHRALEDFCLIFVSVIFSYLELETKFHSVAQLTKLIFETKWFKIIKLIFLKNELYRALIGRPIFDFRSTDT
jgi:hypothetical protein